MSRSPLLGQSRKVDAPEGCTLAQLAGLAEPDAFARRYLVAFVDGVEVPVEAWEVTRPNVGAIVNLALRAGGGDVFRTILSIAVVAVAAWVSGGALVGVLGSSFAAGGIGAALAGASVAIAGNLILNALVPLETTGQSSARPDPAYTVTGARNQARLLQPAPMVLGRMRMFPPLWGQPIQETVGDEVFLRLAFCLGPAGIDYSSAKIGETPLSSYVGVQLETRLNESDPPHLLYAGDPDQDAVGAALTTSFQSRNTAGDVDEIELVFGWRGGLGRFDDKGRKQSKSVTLIVEYRVAGSGGAWQQVRPNGVQASAAASEEGEPDRSKFLLSRSLLDWAAAATALPSVANGPLTVTRSDPGKAFQYRTTFAVPRAEDGYEVQVRRTTADTADSNAVDQAYWEILGSRKSWVDPFPERKLASAVLRVKATEQLNSIIDTFNLIVEPKVPVFSSGALADPGSASAASLEATATSRNPAHLILNVYRGPQNARPRSDAKIDWPSFAAFAAFCADNGLTFSEEVQGATTRAELARRIAQAGYGRLHKWGGKLAVAIDGPRTGQVPSQTFTPRTISNLRWQKSFPRDVHAVIISFANEENGYNADEVTLYLDGYDAENATKFETLQVPGKTNADEVRIVGRQYINNSLRLTEQFSFDMDAESLSVRPGGYALLQHDVIGVGLGAQRVKSLVMAGDDVAGFVLDFPIKTTAGPTLGCRWRFMDDDGVEAWFEASDEVAVTRDADDGARFMFSAPRDAASAPVPGNLVMVGETEQVSLEVLVKDISPDIGRRASLVVIPYAGERFTPDGSPLPPHDPKVTLPIGARPPTPVLLASKALARELVVTFRIPAMPRGVTLTNIEAAVRESGSPDDSWTPLPPLRADERMVSAPAGDVGAQYDVRLIAVGRDSGGVTVYSDPLVVSEIDADATPAQPEDCAAVFQTRSSEAGAQQLVLVASWDANEDPDILDTAVEMLVSTGPDVWAEIGRARAAVGKVEIHGLQVGRAYNLGFVNLSRRGAPSLRSTIETVTAPDTLVATAASNAVPGSPLDLATADVDSLAMTLLSLQLRVEQVRANLARLAFLEDLPLGSTLSDLQTRTTNLESSLTSTQTLLGARIDGALAAISNENTARVAGQTALASQYAALAVRTAAAEVAIANERLTRIEVDSAEAYERGLLAVRMGAAEANIVTERVARLAKDDALASLISSLGIKLTNIETGDTAQALALTDLSVRVTKAEGLITVQSQSLTALSSQYTLANQGIAANASALNGLTTRVTNTENTIQLHVSSIAQLKAQYTNQQLGITANANALTSVSARVTQAENNITAQTAAVQELSAEVAGNVSNITYVAAVYADLNGRFSNFFALRGVAGSSEWEFAAMAGGNGVPSKIRLRASQIEMDGDVVVTGSLTTRALSYNASTERKLYDGSSGTLPSNATYATLISSIVPTEGGWVEFDYDLDVSVPNVAGDAVQLDIQTVVAGIVRRTSFHYCKDQFSETRFGKARFTCPNSSTIELRVRAHISGGGVSGVTVANVQARSIENKR